MDSEFVIRKMTEADADAVWAMDAECFETDAWEREWFVQGVTEPNANSFVATIRGAYAGCIVFYDWPEDEPPYIKVAHIAVLGRFRRKGLGKRLMRLSIDKAEELGIGEIMLETAADNAAAKALYEGLGFKAEEVRAGYYASGKDALIMYRREEPIAVKSMAEADIDAVLALHGECFGDDVWPREWFEEGVESNNGHYFAAWSGAEVVGFVGFYDWADKTPPYVKIATLAVRERFRRKGLARRLLGVMFDFAAERGIADFKLETAADNPASLPLYESLGFKVEETIPNYYDKSGKDGLIMWKRS